MTDVNSSAKVLKSSVTLKLQSIKDGMELMAWTESDPFPAQWGKKHFPKGLKKKLRVYKHDIPVQNYPAYEETGKSQFSWEMIMNSIMTSDVGRDIGSIWQILNRSGSIWQRLK